MSNKTMYLCTWSIQYGSVNMSEVVVKETPKTYKIIKEVAVEGHKSHDFVIRKESQWIGHLHVENGGYKERSL